MYQLLYQKIDNYNITLVVPTDNFIDKKDKYALFLDNNHPLIVVTNNDIDTDREIVVIKDSYANSFIPFLINIT